MRAAAFVFGVTLASVSATAATCAGAAERTWQPPVRSLLEIRREYVVVQKWDLSCGAAAVATVLTHQHGYRITEKDVAEAMLRRTDALRVKVRGGFSLLDLKRFVDGRGFIGEGYRNLTIEDLLEAGPTIVPVNLKGYNHFVVFKGISEGHVVLADPAYGNRRITLSRFAEAWIENIGFVVRRQDGAQPAHNKLVPRPGEAAGPPDIVVQTVSR